MHTQKSLGHLGYSESLEGGRMEVFAYPNGDVYWAPVTNVVEVAGPNKGRRCGRYLCRIEQVAHLIDLQPA
mgnify:CR=1 FL=1